MKRQFLPVVIPLVAMTLLVGPALGQSEKIMRGKDLNESALIEALTPEPVPDNGHRDRNFTLSKNAPPAKPASASLLITFETNSAELTPQAKQSLEIVGRALKSERLADFRFGVEGHADPRGEPDFNLELSRLRAESVREYLVQNNYIENRRLEAVGKGDRHLLNKANPAAPENRRVTIVNLSQ
jgi:OOP family OmpA-OmpF porin